ncbi:MAG: iron-containing redox enzyme family protein [Planctomycetes bacterium]|nr:iron-containing redox enzyme family protein [Planctomycetota bacterium]
MSFVDELREALLPARMRLFSSRLFQALVADEKAPLDLWRVYLWESYHYVKHNGINQALAVLRTDPTEKRLMIRYLKHALEEIDHDEMCLRDLEKLGVPREEVIASRPLPETAAFSSFLYDFVMRDNPIGRLGYSFWAEGFNEESGYIVERLRHHFGLPDDHMQFVVAHAHLDARHGKECVETIERFATTKADREAILYFGVATCHQFYYVLEAMYERSLRERAARA